MTLFYFEDLYGDDELDDNVDDYEINQLEMGRFQTIFHVPKYGKFAVVFQFVSVDTLCFAGFSMELLSAHNVLL